MAVSRGSFGDLQGIGHSLSGYASLILRSDEDVQLGALEREIRAHPDSLQRLSGQPGQAEVARSLGTQQSGARAWIARFGDDEKSPARQVRFQGDRAAAIMPSACFWAVKATIEVIG